MLHPLLPDSVMEHGPIMRRPTPHNIKTYKCLMKVSNDSPEVSIFPKDTRDSIGAIYIVNVDLL